MFHDFRYTKSNSNLKTPSLLLATKDNNLRTKDVNKNNIIRNNIVHHCGEVIWHGHGIFAWQSGENLLEHNYVHDVPRKAMGLCGVRCQILMKPDDNFDEASRTIRWSEIEKTIENPICLIKY